MVKSGARRTRITVDTSPELWRRVKVAAADRDKSVRDFVVDALEMAVSEPESARWPAIPGVWRFELTEKTIEDMDQLREKIMHGRVFTADSAEIIARAREERSAELERIRRGS